MEVVQQTRQKRHGLLQRCQGSHILSLPLYSVGRNSQNPAQIQEREGRGEVILKKSTMIGENFGNCNLTQLLYFYITEIKLSAPLKIFFF